jgi:hypothetical protein
MVETFDRWIKGVDDEPIDKQDAQTLLSAWPYEYEENEFNEFLAPKNTSKTIAVFGTLFLRKPNGVFFGRCSGNWTSE